MEDNGVICMAPWVHMAYTLRNKARVCCKMKIDYEPSTYFEDTKQLRIDMLNGISRPECNNCTMRGKKSLRNGFNSYHNLELINLTEDYLGLREMEISLDNICNLKCRMCTSEFSSNLYKRDVMLEGAFGSKSSSPKRTERYRLDTILEMDINWADLRRIKVLGGEPFYSPNFIKLLKFLKDRCLISKMHIEIASNLTHKPTEEVLDILSKFKQVELACSIDGTKKYNDYQRVGASFDLVIANYIYVLKYLKNIIYPHIHSTYSLLNLNNIVKDIEWYNNEWIKLYPEQAHVSFNLVKPTPSGNLTTSVLVAPDEYIKWLYNIIDVGIPQTDLIIKFIKADHKYNKSEWQGFLDHTKTLDEFHGMPMKDYNPELWEFIRGL